ncbi:MAG: hypothetical protein ACREQ9_05790 [Candidatus Binatia bacterium]
MSERSQRLLIAHGGMVFLAGLAVGFPFAFFVSGEISLWPIPWKIVVQLPGTERGWRMAHLEGILNGLTLIAVGAVGARLSFSVRAEKWILWSLVVTAWGNVAAATLGPLFTTPEHTPRGLAFGGGAANSLMYLLFVLAILAVMIAMVLVVRAALAATPGAGNPLRKGE